MNDNDLKGKIACELIIEATETKGKRPTQLNFDELIDVVTGVVKKLTIPRVSQRSELLAFAKELQNIGFNTLDDAEKVVDLYLKANCG